MDFAKASREKSLDALVERSVLAMDGVDIKFSPATETSPGLVIFPDNRIRDLTAYEALYMEHLFTVGYESRSKLWKQFHRNTEIRAVDILIKRLRKKIGKDQAGNDIIRTRYGSGRYEGGYFVGRLEEHRNEPENIVEAYGYTLNKVTGCLRIPGNEIVFLTPFETKYLEHLFDIGYASKSELRKQFHQNTVLREVDSEIVRLRRILRNNSEGNDLIQTRGGFGGYGGGYFVGRLEDHRNEPENIVEAYGHSINKMTGCLRLHGRQEVVFFNPLDTVIMAYFIENHGKPVERYFMRHKLFPNDITNNGLSERIIRLNDKIWPELKIVEHGTSYALSPGSIGAAPHNPSQTVSGTLMPVSGMRHRPSST